MLKRAGFAYGSLAVLAVLIGGSAIFGIVGRQGDDSCGGARLAGESADIGGPFVLVNGEGETVTDAQVISKPSLVYFGYTFCPDVCPFDVARNAAAVDLLSAMELDITPVFITVDPGRDTPDVMAEYAEAFHPGMIGLSGSPEQVEQAAGEYRVYFRRQESDDDFYLVDHSTFTYLAMPESGVVDYFRRDDGAEELARRTACQVRRHG